MIHSMTRREAVALVGLSGIALLARRSAAQGTGRVPGCVVRPQQTEGPFFIEEKLNRSDIRTDPGRSDARPGAVLQLAFAVSRLSGGACAPLSGAQVDVWHCDALGAYSDGAQKFLRGYQVTDDTGAARFVTIYPGAYQGRAVHIHFKIRLTAQRQEFTSQIYFDEAVTNRAHAQAPYAGRGGSRLRNERDGLYRQGGRQLTVTPLASAGGWATTFDLALGV
jgi:protocatechuate 3,4-dioxygenase beta subunit